ncbi:Gfo/Idh/MocA family oxidoreductase [Flavobacterium sp. F-65]|uniref:Gfo/Idh/MocA family oxidoreductase n=1 Tax=Flavobacterium pisciphilum TaxID=2893755 RepID=A0ABS8MSL4_9FLAO|nr:Gfo/Idh/MocA family oxidoreductase [Flavobacterium sp. F-65]MCC9071733.1 Gfo/Idh/MocA family oxidoreductase [Flavobacterium sp. F-65]
MKILIIGLGSIAKKHVSALKSMNINIAIYALRSNPNSQTEEGIENVYDIENLDFSFDFAIISNPTHLHFDFIEKLAKLYIPLFIEKPAVHRLQNIDKLIDFVEMKQVVTYVACNLRFHPCIEFLKNKLNKESLKINEVNVYCGSYLPDWRPNVDFKKVYSANVSMGGGVHLDLFHELDYVSWLFGMPNKSSSTLRNVSSLNIDAIDYANYILEYDTFTANVVLNYYRKKSKRVIELVCDNEILEVDLINSCITNDSKEIIFEATNFDVKNTYSYQLNYFINCLKENILPMNGLRESIEILKIVLKDE